MNTQLFSAQRIAVAAVVVLTGLAGCMSQGGSSSPSPSGLPAPGLPSGMPPSGLPGPQGSGQPGSPSSMPPSGQSGSKSPGKSDGSQSSGSGKSTDSGSQPPSGGVSCKGCAPDPRGNKPMPGTAGGPPGVPGTGSGQEAGLPKKGDVRDTPRDGAEDGTSTTGSGEGQSQPEYGALPSTGSGRTPGGDKTDDPLANGSTPGEDGWVTSNEIPGTGDGTAPGKSGDGTKGGAAGSGKDGTSDGTEGSGTDAVLDDALGGLDGKIMSERDAARERGNGKPGNEPGMGGDSAAGSEPTGHSGDDLPAGGTASNDGMVPGGTTSAPVIAGAPSNRTQPPAPRSTSASSSVPDDIPTGAHDDDIIARQLREAAMKETDPELREKLWEEYRRYKGM